jgi:drug/metabolite transporter (DMT)-like permease
MSSRGLVTTSEGENRGAFTPGDWGLLLLAAGIWGASFLFMEIALDAFHPSVVTLGRIGFGFLALVAFPKAREPVDREDWPRLWLLGFCWMAFPLSMFPIAQQWIDSTLAGMLNASMPITTAALAAVLLRRLPGSHQTLGLAIGFVGIVLIGAPSLGSGSSEALGVVLVLLAMVSYSVAANVAVPLTQKYHSLQVMVRVAATALVMVLPLGLAGLPSSEFAWGSLLAVIAAGALGTGVAFVAAGALMARVGATRGSIITYIIPVVSTALGISLLDESVAIVSVIGMLLVFAGAWLASRAEVAPTVQGAERPADTAADDQPETAVEGTPPS